MLKFFCQEVLRGWCLKLWNWLSIVIIQLSHTLSPSLRYLSFVKQAVLIFIFDAPSTVTVASLTFLCISLVFNCISITIISVHWTLNIEPFVHLLSYNHFWFLYPTFGFWYLRIVFSFSCLMWSICSKYYPESYTLASCLQVFWELLF